VCSSDLAGARVAAQDDAQTRARIRDDELARKILFYCEVPRSSSEIIKSVGLKMRTGTFIRTMNFLLGSGLLRYLIPDKPRSGKQRYVITEKGKDALEVKVCCLAQDWLKSGSSLAQVWLMMGSRGDYNRYCIWQKQGQELLWDGRRL
jgi:hypothetical protein